MPAPVNLTQATVEQVQDFLNSFDVVLSDCDGVIWYLEKVIPGAIGTLSKLQELGKRLYLVTNNSVVTVDRYSERLRINGLNVKLEQIINTAKAITWYLKKIEFSGAALVIGTTAFRQVLIDSGIEVSLPHVNIQEDEPWLTLKDIQDRPNIKAVIVDFSFYVNWGTLALVISCLQKKDVLYICGAQDDWVVYGFNKRVIGPGAFINIITKYSGRMPISCAKPSEVLKDYLIEMCGVKDPKRCLFIGDTVHHDMMFGSMCGFKKMFVDTGFDTIKDAEKSEETCPDFYIPSLGLLHPIIDSLQKNSVNKKTSQ